MNWFQKLFGLDTKHENQNKLKKSDVTTTAEKLNVPANIKQSDKSSSVSISEARAKAEELGILSPRAVAAALNLEHISKDTIYVHGVITCVCLKSLPVEVDITPGWAGGGKPVSCPNCGTRIAIMNGISDRTAIVVAVVEAVKQQYQSSKISLILTKYSDKQKEDEVKPQNNNKSDSIENCDWCSMTDMRDQNSLLSAFKNTQFNNAKPDWRGLEQLSSKLKEGWMRHVLWLNIGVECKSKKRWIEAARCFTISLWEYYQYSDWSDGRSASWGITELAEMPESWEIISSSLSPEKVAKLGEKLRIRSNRIDAGAELNKEIVLMIRETFTEWPN